MAGRLGVWTECKPVYWPQRVPGPINLLLLLYEDETNNKCYMCWHRLIRAKALHRNDEMEKKLVLVWYATDDEHQTIVVIACRFLPSHLFYWWWSLHGFIFLRSVCACPCVRVRIWYDLVDAGLKSNHCLRSRSRCLHSKITKLLYTTNERTLNKQQMDGMGDKLIFTQWSMLGGREH